jgi:hypothetical protein
LVLVFHRSKLIAGLLGAFGGQLESKGNLYHEIVSVKKSYRIIEQPIYAYETLSLNLLLPKDSFQNILMPLSNIRAIKNNKTFSFCVKW